VAVSISHMQDAIVLYANDYLVEMSGIPRDELVGANFKPIYVDPNKWDELIEKVQESGQVRGEEVEIQWPNGKRQWVMLSMLPLRYFEEDTLLVAALDITERKHAEQRLQQDANLLQRLLDLNERERQLIAYEIHDGIVQDITASLMFVETARDAIEEDGRSAGNHLDQTIEVLRASVDEARRMIDGLRSPALEEDGVVAAIRNLVVEQQRKTDVAIVWQHDIEFERVAPSIEMAIYRIAQESLTNALKHSGTSRVVVSLRQEGKSIVIQTQDWGKGFDPETVQTKHYGLRGVRERARLLGGIASIDSELGEGATIRVSLPLTDVLLPLDELG